MVDADWTLIGVRFALYATLSGLFGLSAFSLYGLKAGEQVMVDGFQKLRGAKVVKPVPWQEKAGTPGQPDGKAAAPAEAAGNAAKAPAEPAKAGAGAAR